MHYIIKQRKTDKRFYPSVVDDKGYISPVWIGQTRELPVSYKNLKDAKRFIKNHLIEER